jgi:RNA polymerase sigma-70 factor (TIGR02960 family)
VQQSPTTERQGELEERFEQHRSELTAYAYRMLGSPFEAEDAVQETFIRAWRGYDRFEGRSALRSWLYRITTNVCLDMLGGRERRARPMDLGPAWDPGGPIGGTLPEVTWIEPVPDGVVVPADGDPADVAVARETIKLAFVAALQHLPPRQRAVLILCEVLRWKAAEVAELLETSVASVNSALQRARATLEQSGVSSADPAPTELDDETRELLARYVEAFERYDMDELTSLIQEGRDPVDAAVRAVAPRPRGDPQLVGRSRRRLPRLQDDRDRLGQRLARVRPVQAEPGRRGLRPVGAAGARDRERPDRRVHLLPRHRARLPAVRAAARLPGVAVVREHVAQPHEGQQLAQLGRDVQQPYAAAQAYGGEWRRASASTVTASGVISATSQYATSGAERANSAQTRSQRPGRSSRAIGPRIANETVLGARRAISARDRPGTPELIGAAAMSFAAAAGRTTDTDSQRRKDLT